MATEINSINSTGVGVLNLTVPCVPEPCFPTSLKSESDDRWAIVFFRYTQR